MNTKKQICRFILAGIIAVGTDCATYYLYSMFMGLSLSKTLSFLTGTVVAYFINKYYTFEVKEKSLKEAGLFLVLYVVSLGANVGTNYVSLKLLPQILATFSLSDEQVVKLGAFLCATGVSTIMNFVGQKFFVFNQRIK